MWHAPPLTSPRREADTWLTKPGIVSATRTDVGHVQSDTSKALKGKDLNEETPAVQ